MEGMEEEWEVKVGGEMEGGKEKEVAEMGEEVREKEALRVDWVRVVEG